MMVLVYDKFTRTRQRLFLRVVEIFRTAPPWRRVVFKAQADLRAAQIFGMLFQDGVRRSAARQQRDDQACSP